MASASATKKWVSSFSTRKKDWEGGEGEKERLRRKKKREIITITSLFLLLLLRYHRAGLLSLSLASTDKLPFPSSLQRQLAAGRPFYFLRDALHQGESHIHAGTRLNVSRGVPDAISLDTALPDQAATAPLSVFGRNEGLHPKIWLRHEERVRSSLPS